MARLPRLPNSLCHPPWQPLAALPCGDAVMTTKPITAIKVGKRHRKDLGDIAGLARSIEEVGLLHPVVIRPNGQLIAGGRRLKACKALGWSKIPCTVVDLDQIILGELHENAIRKDFLP